MTLKRILYVIAPKEFRDEEYFIPERYFTQEQHYQVDTYSTQKGTAIGMFGGDVEVTLSLEDATNATAQYDALVIAGGMGSPQYLWENPLLRKLIIEFNTAQKLVAAICISGVALAKAGILTHKNATVWKCDESIAAYKEAQVNFIDEPVITDGLIITANGPEASEAFAKTIATVLNKSSVPVS
jgi:protease I